MIVQLLTIKSILYHIVHCSNYLAMSNLMLLVGLQTQFHYRLLMLIVKNYYVKNTIINFLILLQKVKNGYRQ